MSRPSTTSRFRRRGVGQRLEAERRAQVGEHVHAGAQAQQAGLGPLVARRVGPLAGRRPRPSARRRRPWRRPGSRRSAACRARRSWRRRTARSSMVRSGVSARGDAAHLGGHLGADAVAGQEQQVGHGEGLQLERAFGGDLVGEELAVGNPEARARRRARPPCAAVWKWASSAAWSRQTSKTRIRPGLGDVLGVGIGDAAVLGAAGGQHGLHVRPKRRPGSPAARGPCRR